MLNNILNKQRLAVRVVKTALGSVGIHGRSICVTANSWLGEYGRREEYAVFISSSIGEEPFYVQGSSIVEAVRNMIDSIKDRVSDAAAEVSETAPF